MSITVPLDGFGGGNPLNFKESTQHPGCYYRTVDGATEWLNPPMVVGTEYRTVERYKGNVVYTKAVNLGTLPNATEKSVTLNIAGTKIVSMRAIAIDSDGTFEFFPITYSEDIGATVWVSSKKIMIGTFQDYSNYTGTAFIKYTK